MDLNEQAKKIVKILNENDSSNSMNLYLTNEIKSLSISEAKELLLFTEDQCNSSTLKNAKAAAAIVKSIRLSLEKNK